MQLDPNIADQLRAWAAQKHSVCALWLFGSRVKGTATPTSDLDIALELMPRKGADDPAFGTYLALHREWKNELERIVGGEVSMIAFRPGDLEGPLDPRIGGVRLWARTAS